MDAATAAKPENLVEALTQLDRHRREAIARKNDLAARLACERDRLCIAEGDRQCNVAGLASAEDEADRGYLADSIEKAEAGIRDHSRMIESYTVALTAVATELDQVRNEWAELNKAVEARERAEKFEADKKRIASRFCEVANLLEGSRLGLGDLVMDAFRLAEEFGPPASQFLTVEAEKFFQQQNSPSNRGLTQVYGWNGSHFEFWIRPMQRKRL